MFGETYTTHSSGQIVIVRSPHYGEYRAFMPNSLPPTIEYTNLIVDKLGNARSALRGLAEIGSSLPTPNHLIIPYLRKEAELSSRIEGTQASLEDLYLFEANEPTTAPTPDVQEVRNYFTALHHGVTDPRPVSVSLVKELHALLMDNVRGQRENPGHFRNTQNYIALTKVNKFEEAIYVPPPPSDVEPLLLDWERFYKDELNLTPLIKIALAHYQFEAIHPFGDGNGRVGRLLIILMLKEHQLIQTPLLYLSAFFERTRQQYYSLLKGVTERGEWNPWIEYFLEAVVTQSEDAIARSHSILNLSRNYIERIKAEGLNIKYMTVLDLIFDRLYIRTSDIATKLQVTPVAAANYLRQLTRLGIIEEITGNYSHRVYRASELVKLLQELRQVD